MLRGVYQSTSALLALQTRHEAISANLTNLQTAGYKAFRPALGAFAQLLLQRQGGPDADTTVGALGTDVAVVGGKTDTSQGALRETDQELDLALTGEGFFTIRTPDGLRYTRAGRFSRNADGYLVTPEGWFVLGRGGDPLRVGTDPVLVEPEGHVVAGGKQIGEFATVQFDQPAFLGREDMGPFYATAASGNPMTVTVHMLQGFIEEANVDAAQTMVDLMATFRAYEANQRAMEAQDETLRLAVNDLARF